MTWAEIRERLLADKGNWSQVARETGLHINGIRKLAIGETTRPRIDTVEKIAAYYGRFTPGKPERAREAA
jgi:hypothetical protein